MQHYLPHDKMEAEKERDSAACMTFRVIPLNDLLLQARPHLLQFYYSLGSIPSGDKCSTHDTVRHISYSDCNTSPQQTLHATFQTRASLTAPQRHTSLPVCSMSSSRCFIIKGNKHVRTHLLIILSSIWQLNSKCPANISWCERMKS